MADLLKSLVRKTADSIVKASNGTTDILSAIIVSSTRFSGKKVFVLNLML
jgi:hypothetical protein